MVIFFYWIQGVFWVFIRFRVYCSFFIGLRFFLRFLFGLGCFFAFFIRFTVFSACIFGIQEVFFTHSTVFVLRKTGQTRLPHCSVNFLFDDKILSVLSSSLVVVTLVSKLSLSYQTSREIFREICII